MARLVLDAEVSPGLDQQVHAVGLLVCNNQQEVICIEETNFSSLLNSFFLWDQNTLSRCFEDSCHRNIVYVCRGREGGRENSEAASTDH